MCSDSSHAENMAKRELPRRRNIFAHQATVRSALRLRRARTEERGRWRETISHECCTAQASGSLINKEEEENSERPFVGPKQRYEQYVRTKHMDLSVMDKSWLQRATSTVSHKGSIPRDSICDDVRVPPEK